MGLRWFELIWWPIWYAHWVSQIFRLPFTLYSQIITTIIIIFAIFSFSSIKELFYDIYFFSAVVIVLTLTFVWVSLPRFNFVWMFSRFFLSSFSKSFSKLLFKLRIERNYHINFIKSWNVSVDYIFTTPAHVSVGSK